MDEREVLSRASAGYRRACSHSRTRCEASFPLAFACRGARASRGEPCAAANLGAIAGRPWSLPDFASALCRHRARPGGFRGGGAAGLERDSRTEMGGAVPAGVWYRHHRRNDVDHQHHRASLLFRGLPVRLAEPQPRHRVRSVESGLWAICLLSDRIRRRFLHEPPNLEAELRSQPAHRLSSQKHDWPPTRRLGFWGVNRNCPHPPLFCMCGRERAYDEAILYVWQPKELRAYFSDVWQRKDRKDLALNVARL